MLLLACASLKAATEILWEESDATESPRGRIGGFGAVRELDENPEREGDGGRTWRKDLRLNEELSSSWGDIGDMDERESAFGGDRWSGWWDRDLVQKNFELGFFCVVWRGVVEVGWLGSERVERGPW